jgi:hypothetical protein
MLRLPRVYNLVQMVLIGYFFVPRLTTAAGRVSSIDDLRRSFLAWPRYHGSAGYFPYELASAERGTSAYLPIALHPGQLQLRYNQTYLGALQIV